MDRKNFSCFVWIIDGSHVNAAGGYAECGVLESFRFLD